MRNLGALASCIVFLLATVFATPAAGREWCEEDPVFVANLNTIDVTTTFDATYASSISGPITFLLLVPSNTLAPAVVSVDGTVPVRGYIVPSLPPSSLLGGSTAVLRVWMSSSTTFPIYTKITGLTRWGAQLTLADTVAGSSTSVQQVRFTLPLP